MAEGTWVTQTEAFHEAISGPNPKKAFKPHEQYNCHICGVSYWPTSARQKYCGVCAPTKGFRARVRRYGVSATEYARLLAEQDGLCAICGVKPAVAVDHEHDSGRVRGLLCHHCNFKLAALESEDWLSRAQAYLSAYAS